MIVDHELDRMLISIQNSLKATTNKKKAFIPVHRSGLVLIEKKLKQYSTLKTKLVLLQQQLVRLIKDN